MKIKINKTLEWVVFLLFIVLLLVLVLIHIDSNDNKDDLLLYELEKEIQITKLEQKYINQIESINSLRIKNIENRISNLQPRLDSQLKKRITNSILNNCEKYSLSPSLVVHLIFRESSFNHMSTSSKGAIGLMQIMFSAHKDKIKIPKNKLYEIENNINYGCMILKDYIKMSKGNIQKALRRYVGGNEQEYINDIFRLMAEFDNQKYNS